MILTDVDKKILSYIELQADKSITQIAQNLKLRAHTVYYVINKLVQEGIIKKVPFINMARLGYSDYYMFFSLASYEVSQKQQLISFLEKHYLVTWLAELGGEYQYISALYIKSTVELSNFLHDVSTKFGKLFFKKDFSLHTRFARFNRVYLHKETTRQVVTTQTTGEIINIDCINHEILNCITLHPEKSQQEIARMLELPFSTLNYRFKMLKKDKILDRFLYFVDTTQLGIQAFELLIYTKGLNTKFSDELFEFAKKHPNVVHFIQSIGSWDFELGIEVEKMYDATKIAEELYIKFGNFITTISTIPLFKQLKFQFYRGDEKK